MQTDWALLLRGNVPERPDIHLGAEVELASSFVKLLLDKLALLSMLLPVFVLAVLVTIPNTLAGRTLLGRGGPTLGVGFGIIILSFHRFRAKSNRAAQQLPQLPHL